MNPVDFTNADYADGPTVARWLRERDLLPHSRAVASLHRAILRWECGARVTIGELDRWLTSIGVHLSELPDDCWGRGRVEKSGVRYDRATIERALSLLDGGMCPAHVARSIGASPHTLQRWQERERAA